ncbi:potassium channel family protein [Phycicoccus sp. Root101]|uniref:potassium channel family protein n=1 Tax=Phycicoccus sp. Root101 TaxID=1736421 RepID=UPI0012FC2F62|nr:potassium channel family protein [Phycicoccus sp. Root101]
MSDHRLIDWERRTSGPLLVAALAFLGAYAWPILQPQLSRAAQTTCSIVSWTVWLLFAADLFVRLAMSEDRWRYLRRNWLDVITLAVPMLRPLRALRAVVALNIIGRRGQSFVRGRVVAYVAAAVVVVGLVAALAVLDAERGHQGANITTFGDALWWAATTVTTVGYGDQFPTTPEGRFVGAGLMLTGIALLGVITASLASWFVERVAEVQAAEERTGEGVSDLAAELRALRAELTALRQEQS